MRERLKTKSFNISTVISNRLPKHDEASYANMKKFDRNRSSNVLNLIPLQNCIVENNADKMEFVPNIVLSNVMSLAPKIDEVRAFVNETTTDIICISEYCLKESISDNIIDIPGSVVCRKDREEREHGGVCKRLRELENIQFEVLWIAVTPNRPYHASTKC